MRVTITKFSLTTAAAVGVALLAAACSDQTTAPRKLAPFGADLSVVAAFPGGLGSLQQTVQSGDAAVHYCGYNSTEVPVVGTFTGTDCGSAAHTLGSAAVPGDLGVYNPGWSSPFGTSAWIGPTDHLDATQPGKWSNQYVSDTGTYNFIASTASVPSNATDRRLELQVMSDNAVVVYLNGVKIGQNAFLQDCTQAQANAVGGPTCYWTTAGSIKIINSPETPIADGVNTIRVDLVGSSIGLITQGGALPTSNCHNGPQDFGFAGFSGPQTVATPQKTVAKGGSWVEASCKNPTGVDFTARVYYNIPATTTWCSPGYWKNHNDNPPWPLTTTVIGGFPIGTPYQNLKYNSFSGLYARAPQTFVGYDFGKKVGLSDPTLLQVISDPSIYGGPATNNVADILSNKVFGTPIGSGIESCGLN